MPFLHTSGMIILPASSSFPSVQNPGEEPGAGNTVNSLLHKLEEGGGSNCPLACPATRKQRALWQRPRESQPWGTEGWETCSEPECQPGELHLGSLADYQGSLIIECSGWWESCLRLRVFTGQYLPLKWGHNSPHLKQSSQSQN